MSNQANESAFPEIYTDHETSETSDKVWSTTYSAGGLTKREHFSIQIYASMMSVPATMEERKHSAGWAVKCADFLLAELENERA